MSYQHLTTFERARIDTLQKIGYSIRKISDELRRSPSTISRELRRNTVVTQEYRSEIAQDIAHKRRLACRPDGKWSPELARIIQEKLDQTWSPEQIVNRLFFLKRYLSRPCTDGFIKGFSNVIFASCATKGNVRNRKKHVGALTSVRPFKSDRKTFENVKHLVIGNSIRSSRAAEKVKVVWLRLLSARHVGISSLRCRIVRQLLWSQRLKWEIGFDP